MTHDSEQVDILTETTLTGERLQSLADGVAAEGTERITVRAPGTNEPLGSVPDCDEGDVERAVERAREVQPTWSDSDPERRGEILDRFGDLVFEHRGELLDLLQLETGKSRQHAVEEIVDVPVNCSYCANEAPEILESERRRGVVPLATTAHVTYEPVGVVGAISPWNYPVTLSMADVIPALVAGNAVVLKPDEKTPFVALMLAELLEEAGLPDGVFQVVTGQGDVAGPALVDRVDYVSFTGGTETGRLVAEQAGRNLIGHSLELGGKNPLLVLDDANPREAARGAVQACFTNAGQLCLSAERIYVDESVSDEFLDAFVGATRRLSLGTELSYEPDVGSLIGADQLERVESHVADAVDAGATLLTGGRHRPDVGPYVYEPTVFTDVDRDATLACEETFGPVVTVESVPDTEAAVAAANNSEYGLNASVWTGDRRRGARVAERVDCGTVCVNDGHVSGWGSVDAPMGGFGDSGVGRRQGPEGIKRFLETRTVATSRVGPLTAPPGVPTSWYARVLLTVGRLQRRVSKLPGLGRWFS
jgi:succinate-semialdehyde dehydrogenase/glutarate-semialdehyde dehydrogenase